MLISFHLSKWLYADSSVFTDNAYTFVYITINIAVL